MAASGYKLFVTGDVLTAAQVNDYLMLQTVMVFASSAARTTALSGVLAEGLTSYLKDTNSLEIYDGSGWVSYGSGDITAVSAGTGISVASGTGPVPVVTNSMATEITAKGDLIAGTGSATFDNLPVGTNGQTLVADSTTATGLKWATASSTPSFSGVYCGGTTAQSISSTTQTIVTWDLEVYDTDGYHSTSTNTGRITIPSGKAGYYLVHVAIQYAANATAGHRTVYLVKNGSIFLNGGESSTGNSTVGTMTFYSMIVNLAVGDYITAECYFNGTMNVNKDTNYPASYFQAQYLGA